MSFGFIAHLIKARIDALIDIANDALDNALMESEIDLYETETI